MKKITIEDHNSTSQMAAFLSASEGRASIRPTVRPLGTRTSLIALRDQRLSRVLNIGTLATRKRGPEALPWAIIGGRGVPTAVDVV